MAETTEPRGCPTPGACSAMACLKRIGHLEMVMRECCDAIRDNDEFGALRMLEVALKEVPNAT